MKLSIIIPCYNSEKYIQDCLNSILLKIENRNDIEVILINDGSNDNTIQKYDMYKRIPHLEIIENENRGVSFSRNCGIEKALGKYIMFVDSDDVLASNWIEVIEPYFEANSDIIYFNNNIPIESSKEELIEYIVGCKQQNVDGFAGPYCKLFKKNILINNNIRFCCNIISGEDLLFNIEALTLSEQIKIVNSSFYKYRIYYGQSTRKFNPKKLSSDLEFHKEINRILNPVYISNKKKNMIMKFCLLNAIFILICNFSYLENFEEFRHNFVSLYSDFYLKIQKKDLKSINNKKIKLILFLYINKKVFLIYLLIKTNMWLKKEKYKEYFIDI